MVKTYILAPDYSTAPPPKGPVQLGDVLTDLSKLMATNRTSRVPIPATDFLPVDYKYRFRATRSQLQGGDLGVWAQLASIFGVGVETGWTYEAHSNDVFKFAVVETHAFNLTLDYVRAVMDSESMRKHVKDVGGKRGYVFIITGLKIGQGAQVETEYSVEKGMNLKLGFAHPGVPLEGGPECGVRRRKVEGLSFEGSTDFVIAFRVRKIIYKKGVLLDKAHNRGATMMDGEEGEGEESELHLELADEAELDDVQFDYWQQELQAVSDRDGDDQETLWIIPKVALERKT
ncbi:hypothetical protein CSIM01_07530 [Colletotrichum simmondsii]|uniref:Uncharacterized protein n=1 Tax=Colletotrichum simmondsii TaxID=703756 RepID=A0A135SAH2_9PEZI|nr:hypothetical protein CSIM01_07530 [Colletotrichum simmondsii]